MGEDEGQGKGARHPSFPGQSQFWQPMQVQDKQRPH